METFQAVSGLSGPSADPPGHLDTLRTIWRLSGSSESFPGQLETFQAIWRLSGTSEDFPDHLETFQSNMKLSRPYQDFPGHLETTCYPQEEKKFPPHKTDRIFVKTFTRPKQCKYFKMSKVTHKFTHYATGCTVCV